MKIDCLGIFAEFRKALQAHGGICQLRIESGGMNAPVISLLYLIRPYKECRVWSYKDTQTPEFFAAFSEKDHAVYGEFIAKKVLAAFEAHKRSIPLCDKCKRGPRNAEGGCDYCGDPCL
jgi:hypothetical protein